MLVAEKAWLAATIDGEGSLGLYRAKDGRYVQIQMGNTNKRFVDEMRRIVGCGSRVRRHKFAKSHKGRKPMFHYSLKGSTRCYWVLKQITDYLIIKKQKALDIIKELEQKPFGRWVNATLETRKRHSDKLKKQWKNPEIRARRIKGMRRAACRK